MAVEGQRDAKNAALIPSVRTLTDSKFGRDSMNAALIPSVRTLADSKLGVDLFRGSASLELYRGSFFQVAAQRLQKRFIYYLSKEDEYMTIYRISKP
ncbi:hypothetical protein C4D60_Mb04t15740 [Musa balbisiana]|uniref:Uncharacterized protein n=1 Tax=Musa balbisiana TaxID=52838 RepID=A0A4V4H9S8_MUSBA|nr:hypothetical protein C4D60_Mb04t15740 [Musa balbisiana]